MRKYKFGNNKRAKDHGLLVSIQKSIKADCKRNGIENETFSNEIGTTSGVLSNKFKMSNNVNAVSIEEFIHIMEITGDYRPLKYLASMFDFVITSTEPQSPGDVSNLGELADSMQIESNESFSEIKRAIKDGQITEEEKNNMLKEVDDSIEAALQTKNAISSIQAVEIKEDQS